MTDTLLRRALSSRPHFRATWPRGFLGWLSYVSDHVLFGFRHPIDWQGFAVLEECGVGQPITTASGTTVVYGLELDVLRLVGRDRPFDLAAKQLRISEERFARVRADLVRRLGAEDDVHLARIADEHGLR